MAYDKVIDSAQFEAAITATANAIREKTGDSALIQWLADKGFAEAIATIEAGGRGKMVYGSYTDATTDGTRISHRIDHNFGSVPKIAVAFDGDVGKGFSAGNRAIGGWAFLTDDARFTVELRSYSTGATQTRMAVYTTAEYLMDYVLPSGTHGIDGLVFSGADIQKIVLHLGRPTVPGHTYHYIILG